MYWSFCASPWKKDLLPFPAPSKRWNIRHYLPWWPAPIPVPAVITAIRSPPVPARHGNGSGTGGKLSGPLMDRIDLQVIVNRLKPEEITRQKGGEPSAPVRDRVEAARKFGDRPFQRHQNPMQRGNGQPTTARMVRPRRNQPNAVGKMPSVNWGSQLGVLIAFLKWPAPLPT